MAASRVWTMKKVFDGLPKLGDFEMQTEPLRSLSDGEYLAEAVVLSVDPFNRVTQSRTPKFPVGSILMINGGWRTHNIIAVEKDKKTMVAEFVAPELFERHPSTYFAGVLGMPGATAYFGVTEKLKPKAGETLVVNAAAGAVGAVVGQLGKIMGAKVIGYAGSDAKVAYLKEIGFDHAFNYKTQDLDETLARGAPDGVDLFFDNVGFEFANTVVSHMNKGGRICQCGAIAGYNDNEPRKVAFPYRVIIYKELSLNGIMFGYHTNRYGEFLCKMSSWILQGKIKVKETKYQGFDKMPQALIDVLTGAAEGKAVIVP